METGPYHSTKVEVEPGAAEERMQLQSMATNEEETHGRRDQFNADEDDRLVSRDLGSDSTSQGKKMSRVTGTLPDEVKDIELQNWEGLRINFRVSFLRCFNLNFSVTFKKVIEFLTSSFSPAKGKLSGINNLLKK